MKRTLLIIIFFLSLVWLSGCDNLVNSMDSNKSMDSDMWMDSAKQLSIADTAQALDDLIKMGINSTSGIFTVTFNGVAPNAGVTVTPSSVSGCISIDGNNFFPYGSSSWGGAFNLVFNSCQSTSGTSSYNGSVVVGLSGPLGSVITYDYKGNITAEGAISGNVKIDIHYNDLNCLLALDCWSGTVNEYSIDTLWDIIY